MNHRTDALSRSLYVIGTGLTYENVTKVKTNSAGMELLRLSHEAENLERDAARYRWIREQSRAKELDAAIDVALAKVPT